VFGGKEEQRSGESKSFELGKCQVEIKMSKPKHVHIVSAICLDKEAFPQAFSARLDD
jgi:hypothetical protein